MTTGLNVLIPALPFHRTLAGMNRFSREPDRTTSLSQQQQTTLSWINKQQSVTGENKPTYAGVAS
jgi:hypothetical protein